MPIYEFECGQCGHRFDRLQKLSDTDPTICPTCQQPALHRRVSAPSFRLAGSGWYETDFKKDGDKKRNLAESGDSSGKSSDGGSAATPSPATAAAPAVASPAPVAVKPTASE